MNVKLVLALFFWMIIGTVSGAVMLPIFTLKTPSGNLIASNGNDYYFISFDLAKASPMSLTSNIPIEKVEISPKSRPIPFELKDNKLKFSLNKAGQHMIRINDSIKIFLFAEMPEKVPIGKNVINIVGKYKIDSTGRVIETAKIQQALNELSNSGKILFFPKGTYKSGSLDIRSNSCIYFERGAELSTDTSSIGSYNSTDSLKTKRFIYLKNVENVEIKGYGSINGNGNVLRTKFGDDARMRLIMAVKSKHIVVDGLQLKDPGSWNTQILLCEQVTLSNVKILNNTQLANTDGFDPDGSAQVLIENCFACCSDDNVAIKTTGYAGIPGVVDGITVRGCLFLTRKSALKIGTETRGSSMKNIIFENNDVIESDRGMAIYVSDGAILDSILFQNNRFERNHPDQQ